MKKEEKDIKQLSNLNDQIEKLIDQYNLLAEKIKFENRLAVVAAKKKYSYFEIIINSEYDYNEETGEETETVEGVYPPDAYGWFTSSMQC